MSIAREDWAAIFEILPSLVPLGWTRSAAGKWITGQKLDGSNPKQKNPSKTAAFLNDASIQLCEAGEAPSSLPDYLMLANGWTFPEAAQAMKQAAGIADTYTGKALKPKQLSQSMAKPATPARPVLEVPTEPEELKRHLKTKGVEIHAQGFHGTTREYIEEARSLYYCNEWDILQDIYTGSHNGHPAIVMQFTAPDGRKGGFYHIDPLLLTTKQEGQPRTMKPRAERSRAGKAWLKEHGTIQNGTKGGAVRLAASSGAVGICEGLEDALSIMQASGFFPHCMGYPEARDHEQTFYGGKIKGENPFPVWPCLGKGALLQFEPPAGTTAVYMFPDAEEREGWERDLNETRQRIERAGVKFTAVYPPKGCKDWNEFIKKRLETFDLPQTLTA